MDDTGILEKIRDYLLDQCNLELSVYEHPPDSYSMPEYQEDYCRSVGVRNRESTPCLNPSI